MAITQLTAVFQRLCEPGLLQEQAALTDSDLLERFINRRDEVAFEALVRRHGSMVWGVCRRFLRVDADAEDAFQATFLVLVRKAASIRPRGMVGNWLYGVAQNTARKANAMNQKRRTKEREAGNQPRPQPLDADWQRLQTLLDQELPGLPDKYRAAIVLCDLEGKTIKDAAHQLGWPQGTLATRLARGRALLGKRLARRGLTFVGGGLALVLARHAVAAPMPASLVPATVKSASVFSVGHVASSSMIPAKVITLTEGVLKAMLFAKLKITALVLLTTLVLGAVGAIMASHSLAAEEPRQPASPTAGANPADAKQPTNPPEGELEPGFANAPGWAWCDQNPRKRATFGKMTSMSNARDDTAFTAFFEHDLNDGMMIYLAYRSKKAALEYRPVAFDASHKRFPFEARGGGGNADVNLCKFHLDAKQLPAALVAFLGFEYLSGNGRKVAADDASARMRKAGLQGLPWPQVGKPYEFALTTMEGKEVRTRDLRGKVVVVDCWATWCSPCMSKMPALKDLYQHHHNDGLEIVGICFDHKPQQAWKAIDRLKLAWPQVLAPTDEEVRNLWQMAAGIDALPRLLLIDREGILRADGGPEVLENKVAKLMKQPAGKEAKP